MKPDHAPIRGIVVPLITPFNEAGEVDEPAVERLVAFLIDAGVHGLFALGSSGEFVSLNARKKKRMVSAVIRAAAGRVPVCVGVSGNCLEDIREETRWAARAGANAVAALPPFYFRCSQTELVRFFSAIAEAGPVPLLIYNMPFRTNNNLEPETVERLADHPNIAGIKDTVADMARTLDLLGRLRDREDFAYLHGNELLTVPSLLFGAKGAVPAIANFAPEVMVGAWEAARAGDVERLKHLNSRIQRLMRVWSLLEARPNESTTLRLQAIKMVLERMGICRSYMAQLEEPPSLERLRKVQEFMQAEGLPDRVGEPEA